MTIAPTKDGTLLDGGTAGFFDGAADAADWIFNDSSPGYEGALTLINTPLPKLEHRVVWEFNLSTVTATPPLVATLTFKLRGAARYPAESAVVEVVSYPADLLETLGDFSSAPTSLVANRFVKPYQPPTTFTVTVNEAVNAALNSGVDRVGFRFQLSKDATIESAQAFFVSVLDSNPATKPFLTIKDRFPSDYDGDDDVDFVDHTRLTDCLRGPGIAAAVGCNVFDSDADGDVDLRDVVQFQKDLELFGQ